MLRRSTVPGLLCRRVAIVASVVASYSFCAKAQETALANTPQLTIKTIGHGKTNRGHTMGFRIYKAADDTEGLVQYTDAGSLPEAERQFEDWKKSIGSIATEEYGSHKDPPTSNDRVTGTSENGEHRLLTIIVRRNGQHCYMIKSVWPQIASQIEYLIDH